MLDIFDDTETYWADIVSSWQSKKHFGFFEFNMELMNEIQTS